MNYKRYKQISTNGVIKLAIIKFCPKHFHSAT